MALMEVLDGPAVGNHMAFKAPFVSQNIRKKRLASAAGLSVGAVVSAHHRLHLRFLHTGLESGKISFIQILLTCHCVKLVSQILGAAVHRKMLGTGRRLHIVLVMPLKPLHETHSESGGQIGILPESLMPAAPSGIPEYVHIGRPEGQSLVNIRIIEFLLYIIFCSSLSGNSIRNLLDKILVKGCRQ